MRLSRSIWPTVVVSLLAVSVFPAYAVLVLAPHFEELLVRNTKEEAIRLARSFSTLVLEDDAELGRDVLTTRLLDRLGSLADGGHLVKVRIYSPRGASTTGGGSSRWPSSRPGSRIATGSRCSSSPWTWTG